MKKSLIALAVLAASGAATAQSSVTLFGIVDATIQYGRASGAGSANRLSLGNSGYNSSQLGVRGVEDLGGGLSASFWLEGSVGNDDGRAGGGIAAGNQAATVAGGTGFNFNRRSTVSLQGSWGEVRLGRHFIPSFWNLTVFDPFGTIGVGTTQTLNGSVIPGTISVRVSNKIEYFAPPNLGGFYGSLGVWLGENANNALNAAGQNISDDGRGWGGRIGYGSGPFNVALGWSDTSFATGDARSVNIGGSWNFGIARLMGHYTNDKLGNLEGQGWLIGALMPVGPGEVRVSYSRYTADPAGPGLEPRTSKFALGYVHNLSKRTAVYATWAHARNADGAATTLNAATAGGANRNSSGLDLGVRHAF